MNFDDVIEEMRNEYAAKCQPVSVSFRSIVSSVHPSERVAHYIHSYPGKLLPHIAHFLLAAKSLCPERGIVLDPFGGTGTVALETLYSGRDAYISDVNPLARLIASVKTEIYSADELGCLLDRIVRDYRKSRRVVVPDVVNVDHWFSPLVQRRLARLRAAITYVEDDRLRDFCWVAFSAVVKKVSFADPHFPVPVRTKFSNMSGDRDVIFEFVDVFRANIGRVVSSLKMRMNTDNCAQFVGGDARSLVVPGRHDSFSVDPLPGCSVDMVVTSPPYAGAQKYIRSSSLSIGWIGYEGVLGLRQLDGQSIGRENFKKGESERLWLTDDLDANSLIESIYRVDRVRAAIHGQYLAEMSTVVRELHRVVRVGGRVVIIIGDNMVCGVPFRSSEYLKRMFLRNGFELEFELVDEIKSRGLMTKRNRTAGVISNEMVLFFRKVTQ